MGNPKIQEIKNFTLYPNISDFRCIAPTLVFHRDQDKLEKKTGMGKSL